MVGFWVSCIFIVRFDSCSVVKSSTTSWRPRVAFLLFPQHRYILFWGCFLSLSRVYHDSLALLGVYKDLCNTQDCVCAHTRNFSRGRDHKKEPKGRNQKTSLWKRSLLAVNFMSVLRPENCLSWFDIEQLLARVIQIRRFVRVIYSSIMCSCWAASIFFWEHGTVIL